MTPEELSTHSIHAFNELHEIKNEAGLPLDFKEHSFLWDVYGDMTPVQTVRKAAQVGFSTAAIIKTLWLAKMKNMQVIYTLPTAHDVQDFVSSKVNRIIAQNPIFQTWTADKDAIEQKRVGSSVLYYRGTQTERAALAVSADIICFDESDRSDQKTMQQYESRLQHSAWQWRWYFSNPSSPNIGTDRFWNDSDQKHWFVKCTGCNKEQYLTMENVIMPKGSNALIACIKCGKELDRHSGRWIPRWKGKEVSGRWISALMAPWISADQIIEKQRRMSAEQFDNFVLGIPHITSGNLVTRDTIMRNLHAGVNPQDGQIVIGVDPGADICYVIGNQKGIFNYGKTRTYADIEKFLKMWPNSIVVIDQGGDINPQRALREKYPNRVFLCFYRQDRKTERIIEWNEAQQEVVADRNKLIQLVVDDLTEMRIPLWGTAEEYEDYWQHWSHIYRASEEDTLGVTRHRWMRTDRDDWVHCTAYWRIGIDRAIGRHAEVIAPPGSTFSGNAMEIGYDGLGKAAPRDDISIMLP